MAKLKNKKGFTLIELLAVIIILGILLLIAVPAVSKYIENSRKNTYINSVKSVVDAVSMSVNNLEYSLPKNGEAIIVPFSSVKLEKGNANKKSPFGEFVVDKSYVLVRSVGINYYYYVATLDDKGFAIPLILTTNLSINSITTDPMTISNNIHSTTDIVESNGNKTFETERVSFEYMSKIGNIVKVKTGEISLKYRILSNNTTQSDSFIDFSKISSDTNGKGLYYTSENTEDNKTTYYFRGNVQNNYVKFGKEGEEDIYWRIVRINEDESVRIIYAGNSTDATGIAATIGSSQFNSSYSDNAYAGYMYGTPGSNTYDETHANNNDSTIKKYIDNWYTNNTNLSTYQDSHLVDAGFCNDRSIYTGLGYGTNETHYGAYYRLNSLTKPQFKCPNTDKDLFTLKGSSKGNKTLDNPIGLITADEVEYAGAIKTGGHYNDDLNYYLYTGAGQSATMTPNDQKYVFVIERTGNYNPTSFHAYFYVRPVINLQSNVTVILEGTGEPGTKTNPYVIR